MRFCIFLFFAAVLSAVPSYLSAAAAPFEYVSQGKQVIVRGRVVCLDASGHRPSDPTACQDSSHGFVLLGADGAIYNFLPEDPSTAIFTDPRVRRRELQVTAQARPENHLEIIQVQSILEGKLYEIYYFCEVCNITAHAPGPCPCCRQEFEFRETPARSEKP